MVEVEAYQEGNDQVNAATAVKRSFEVAKAKLSLLAIDKFMIYGSELPNFTVEYFGFRNGDEVDVLTTTPNLSTTATSSSNTGIYPITVFGGSADNYVLSYVDGTLTINKADQYIDILQIESKKLSDGKVSIAAIASSGLVVTFEISGPGSLQGNEITFTGGGTITIRASQSGDINYKPTDIVMSFFVQDDSKQDQTITFNTLANATYGDAAITLSASSSLGLEVSFKLLSGPAMLSGNTLTIAGAGMVEVEAYQEGNDQVNPAISVEQTFVVAKAKLSAIANDQSITYGDELPAATISYTGFVNGESEQHLLTIPQVSTTATNNSDAGIYVINISGGVSDNYDILYAAGILTINKADQQITVVEIGNKDLNDQEIPLIYIIEASSNVNLALSYDVTGPATISGNTLTLSGESGVVIIVVSQKGDQNYNASEVQIGFEVVGLKTLSSEDMVINSYVNVFPNPITTHVNITLENAIFNDYHLEIFNVSGVSVWQKNYDNVSRVQELVEIKQFGIGLYLLKIQTRDESKIIKLIVK
jgi:CheY-specific phosphatase CheX